ncbi:MAG: HAD-IA family hydrolase [Parvularcula sp.]|jgi:phosphoglycolate phosphatase|nr:HAD-IA family hydrolase [Parvularcula sp.]
MSDFSHLVCIFDLDGTLVDSAPDLSAALNRILLQEGLEAMDPAKVRPLVGEGARALLCYGFEEQGRTFPEGAEGDRLVKDYIATYAERISEHSFLFEGVEETLTDLASRGAALAVCTNKLEALAFPLLRDLGVAERFSHILCADSLPERKPSPLPLLTILERTGRKRGVMIGDTLTDLKAAQNAKLPALVARFGYGANDQALKDATFFDHYKELPPLIEAAAG